MDDRDARELHRREKAQKLIAGMEDEDEAERARVHESIMIQDYEDDKRRILQARAPAREGTTTPVAGLAGSLPALQAVHNTGSAVKQGG